MSFDTDWAHDDIIYDTIDLLRRYSVPSTWFVTHKSQIIETIVKDSAFELGIHPNFNGLLSGECGDVDSASVLRNILSIVPGAKSVRSHSLTQNERLIDQFTEFGLTHISNYFIPYGSNIKCKPFYLWGGAIIVPHSWQDNVSLKMDIGYPKKEELDEGLNVFNFHPIHVFLNTEHLDRYEQTRTLHQNPKELIKYRYEGFGTRNKLIELLELTKPL